MTTLYKYRIRCTTDSTDEYTWAIATSEPTTCPTNTAHTIDSSKTTIVDVVEKDTVIIDENSAGTSGCYATTTLVMSATANSVTSHTISWPFPTSALSVTFTTTSDHEGDVINMSVGKDTTTGSITANTAVATAWSAQNYVIGDRVTDGGKLYTCTTNTVSNEQPPNTTYWTRGYEVTVSQTVIDNVKVGYFIKLDDLTNSDDMGRVLSIDTVNLKLYLENNAVNTFLSATPTYIKQSVYNIKDFQIGPPWEYNLGSSKVGGSIIPTDVVVTIDYDNKHASLNKTLVGIVEFMY